MSGTGADRRHTRGAAPVDRRLEVLLVLGVIVLLSNLVSLPHIAPDHTGDCRWKAIPAGDSVALHRTRGTLETPASSEILPPRAALMLGRPFAVNMADLRDLDILPGIGPKLAENILFFRKKHGPFTGPAQLAQVPGIGPALTSRLTPLLTFAVQ